MLLLSSMQIILNGFISGTAIALLAVAFQMVYLPTRVFFIGLAGIYSLAPYLVLAANGSGWPIIIGVTFATTGTVALALFFEWANHAPLARRNASNGAHLISSLGLYIVLVQAIAIIWGNDTRTLRTGLDSTVDIAGAILTGSQLLTGGVACILLIGGRAMLRSSDIGLRLRALADNPNLFALYGYNVDAYRLIAFAIAAVFAAMSSLLTANDIGFDPYSGLHAVLLAVVAVIIGGRHSFVGPAIGGLLVGFVRAQVVWHLSARWQEAVTFAVMAIFLLLRPEGLFGRQARIEASA